ncbi:MAG: LPS assembly protein LptD [Phycisphaeraceae bacterium]|nr:LPS assembly protein LptD [Phycisphaeraceae bacterium]
MRLSSPKLLAPPGCRPSAVLALAFAAGGVFGQTANQLSAGRAPPRDALSITGRDFADMLVGGQAQAADVRLGASKVWLWNEPGSRDVRRLFLQGDVRAEVGTYTFSAAQAVVWIEHLADGEANSPPVRQVAIYFDRVADPGAQAGFAQAADRLLVTGIVRGDLAVRLDDISNGRPEGFAAEFLREAERRLADHLRVEAGFAPSGAALPAAGPGPARPGIDRPFEPGSPFARRPRAAEQAPDEPVVDRQEPIFARDGVITFAVGTNRLGAAPGAAAGPADAEPVVLMPDDPGQDRTALLTGGVLMQYTQVSRNRTLQINAQRAVVFLEPGPVKDLLRFDAQSVKGVYLEGDVVASDGTYTLRGPRVYYDLRTNRATMVDAVFSTYDARRGIPIVVRAAEIRQLSADRWSASRARLATTSFFDPVFAIGATSVTISQRTEPVPLTDDGEGGERTRTSVDARGITLQAGGVPFFWYPRFRGDLENFPLRDLRVDSSSGSGMAIRTAWDVFGLTGTTPPEGVKFNVLYDQYFDRGPAFGLEGDWKDERSGGRLFTYALPMDFGRDSLATGAKVGRDFEFRGIFMAEHQVKFDEYWSLQLEGAAVSDENFVDAFFRPIASEGREFTNAAYLRRTEDNVQASFLAKGEYLDFTPNQYLLQSPGYNTDKLPELRYTRLADDIFAGNSPGWLTYSSDTRLSRMQLNFTEPTAAELGFQTLRRSQAAFGINPNQSIGDQLRARGLHESDVMRFDTRHELAATFDLSPVKLTPFVVGRFTGYDETFEEFSGDGGQDEYRVWYATGVRASTQITRIDNNVESEMFDLHRVRHIIEPNITAWYAGANLSQNDLPVYDDDVESLATAAAVRAGVTQTWQTQRGGAGRWRSVDFLTLRTDYVSSTGDADRESPIGRFFDYRPEYSLLGDFGVVEATWQATDAIALTGGTIYDFDDRQPARSSAGLLIQHNPDLASYAEVRYINALDTTYVDFGAAYRLTRRYSVSVNATYDTDEQDFQNISATLRRRVPEAVFGVSFGYNNITDETNIGFVFQPQGVDQSPLDRLRGLGR